MGRAMLIIAAGAVIAVGILQLGVQGKRTSIAKNSAVDAYEVEIRNKAFTAAQVTMERINEEGTDVGGAENPWNTTIDGTNVTVSYTVIPNGSTGAFAKLEEETIEIHANAEYLDPITDQVNDIDIITSYVKKAMHFVPEFQGAMQFALDSPDLGNFQIQSNASTISGNDISNNQCSSKPAVVVKDQATADKINDGDVHSNLEGDAGDVVVNEDLSYQPVDQLVARLANMESTVKINQYHENLGNNGVWNGDLGSADAPGVFFVEDYAKFASQSEGWGILVVRDAAVIEGETASGEIELRGGFTFNGLVILENAYNMDAAGTININGSVLVGTTEDYSGSPVNIDITGNAEVSYSCEGQKYAQLASAMALSQNRYKRLSTYE